MPLVDEELAIPLPFWVVLAALAFPIPDVWAAELPEDDCTDPAGIAAEEIGAACALDWAEP